MDDQDDMSKQGDSPDCEYWRQLRERVSAEQLTFMCNGAPRQRRMSVYYFSTFHSSAQHPPEITGQKLEFPAVLLFHAQKQAEVKDTPACICVISAFAYEAVHMSTVIAARNFAETNYR